MSKPLCIYHGNCADGFGAAWVVRVAIGATRVDFHAGVYGDAPPDVAGRDVILVDFSYKRPVLEEMAQTARSILVLDHHKTAQDDLAGIPVPVKWWGHHLEQAELAAFMATTYMRALFDMDRSGAMVAWDYFFPTTTPPRLLRHIQDRDLWRFELEGTREIQAALFSHPYDFELWDRLMATDPHDLMDQGAAIERKHFKDIHEFIAVAKQRAIIGGHNVPALNAPYFYSSDAGHIMAEGEPFAACYWDQPDGRVFSLRSTDEGLDVSEIAKAYGGGGHRNAAGFKVAWSAAADMMPEFIR